VGKKIEKRCKPIFARFISVKTGTKSGAKEVNTPIYYRSWSVKRVKKVGHLMNGANSFLPFSDSTELYNIKSNFLSFKASYQLLSLTKKQQS